MHECQARRVVEVSDHIFDASLVVQRVVFQQALEGLLAQRDLRFGRVQLFYQIDPLARPNRLRPLGTALSAELRLWRVLRRSAGLGAGDWFQG